MEDFSSSPEQLSASPEQPQGAPERHEAPNMVEKLGARVQRLDRIKERTKAGTGGAAHDDEDQQRAMQAAKDSRKKGQVMMVMGEEVDIKLVSNHFFVKRASRVKAAVKKDLRKAVDWLASLREAYQAWNSKSI